MSFPSPVCTSAPKRVLLSVPIIKDEVSIVAQFGPSPGSALVACLAGPCHLSVHIVDAELVVHLDSKFVWRMTLELCSRRPYRLLARVEDQAAVNLHAQPEPAVAAPQLLPATQIALVAQS